MEETPAEKVAKRRAQNGRQAIMFEISHDEAAALKERADGMGISRAMLLEILVQGFLDSKLRYRHKLELMPLTE